MVLMLNLLLSTFSAPRVTIAHILRLPMSSVQVMQGALIVSCIAGIFGYALVFMMHRLDPENLPQPGSPFLRAGINFGLMYFVALLIDRVGALFGGVGNFDGALRVSIWSSLVGLVAIFGALIVLYINPQIGLLALTAFSAWSFVLLAIFVQELHHFRNLGLTIAGMLGLAFVLLIAFSTLAVMLGLSPEAV